MAKPQTQTGTQVRNPDATEPNTRADRQSAEETAEGPIYYLHDNEVTQRSLKHLMNSDRRDPKVDIRRLIEHAESDIRLAEITASENSLWHTAEDCRNLYIAIAKLTSTKLEGE